MRVLLDESVPRALGFALDGHFVRTAQACGFAGLTNGKLLSSMKEQSFEVLITCDQNLPYQQNAQLPVAVIVLAAQDNRVSTTMAFVPQILAQLANMRVGELAVLKLQL